jgi:hypothetical protein
VPEQDVWPVIGRAIADPAFAFRLQQVVAQGGDLAHALAAEGFPVPLEDLPKLAAWLTTPAQPAQAQLRAAEEMAQFQVKRAQGLQTYTLDLFKNTLDNARKTYRSVTWMNRILFALGIGLFVAAAVYSAVAQQKLYGLFFGGLGTVAFVGFFVLGPIEKTQAALSNLVQVEIAFMDFFEQITVWEAYALSGSAPGGDPAKIEKASKMLQQRARETIDLLQTYVEKPVKEE